MTGPTRFCKGMRVRLCCAPFDTGIVVGVERRGCFGLPMIVVRWERCYHDITTVSATVLEPL